MFLKILMGFLFLIIVAAETFAAGPAPLSIERFVAVVAKKTGLTANEVRERAIEVLRENGNFSNEDLARIGRHAEASFDSAKANQMIRLLQENAKFRILTGLESLRIDAIQNDAGKAFDQLSDQDAIKALRRASNGLEAALLKSQLTKNLIEAYTSKVDHGKDVVDSTLQLKRLKSELLAVTSELYFATTKFLTLRGIPFRVLISDGTPTLEINVLSASSRVQQEIESEIYHAIAPGQIIRRPAVMIEIANMREDSVYDATRSTLFIGSGSLHRIK